MTPLQALRRALELCDEIHELLSDQDMPLPMTAYGTPRSNTPEWVGMLDALQRHVQQELYNEEMKAMRQSGIKVTQ